MANIYLIRELACHCITPWAMGLTPPLARFPIDDYLRYRPLSNRKINWLYRTI
ncbi:hypothetical protein [Yersinia canariae]|uniref:hypothetical protein n=1 Tax=Yersinia canariae TaxID=2607663 RepID=UPI001359DF69|nr:hypothetical protein [Yersinia canariae]